MKKGEREIKEEYQEGAGNPSPESALCLREISVIGESSWGISGGVYRKTFAYKFGTCENKNE